MCSVFAGVFLYVHGVFLGLHRAAFGLCSALVFGCDAKLGMNDDEMYDDVLGDEKICVFAHAVCVCMWPDETTTPCLCVFRRLRV